MYAFLSFEPQRGIKSDEFAGIENCMDHPAKDALAQQCNLLPCETFSFVKSEWKPCSQTCGTGYTTRRLTCFSSYGYAVSASQCECTDGDCDTFKTCKTNACEEPYHTFSGYSACSVACGGGVKSRTATCNNPDGTVAAASVCEDARLIDERAEVACNTVTCKADSFIWRTGAWSTCTPLACGGTRTREVTCRCVSTLVSELGVMVFLLAVRGVMYYATFGLNFFQVVYPLGLWSWSSGVVKVRFGYG